MTQNEFAAICGEYLVDPALALENDRVVACLRQMEYDELREVFATEF